jgi:hypothetical protein
MSAPNTTMKSILDRTKKASDILTKFKSNLETHETNLHSINANVDPDNPALTQADGTLAETLAKAENESIRKSLSSFENIMGIENRRAESVIDSLETIPISLNQVPELELLKYETLLNGNLARSADQLNRVQYSYKSELEKKCSDATFKNPPPSTTSTEEKSKDELEEQFNKVKINEETSINSLNDLAKGPSDPSLDNELFLTICSVQAAIKHLEEYIGYKAGPRNSPKIILAESQIEKLEDMESSLKEEVLNGKIDPNAPQKAKDLIVKIMNDMDSPTLKGEKSFYRKNANGEVGRHITKSLLDAFNEPVQNYKKSKADIILSSEKLQSKAREDEANKTEAKSEDSDKNNLRNEIISLMEVIRVYREGKRKDKNSDAFRKMGKFDDAKSKMDIIDELYVDLGNKLNLLSVSTISDPNEINTIRAGVYKSVNTHLNQTNTKALKDSLNQIKREFNPNSISQQSLIQGMRTMVSARHKPDQDNKDKPPQSSPMK